MPRWARNSALPRQVLNGLTLKNQPFRRRLRFAWAGIVSAWSMEKSFRVQLALAVGAIGLLAFIRPQPVWWAMFFLAITCVLAAELGNTALEHVIDRLHPDAHPSIKVAKDCAAGAVLVLSLGALGILACLLADVI